MSVWHLFWTTGPVGKFTLFVLFLLSVFTWAVILVKRRQLNDLVRSLKGVDEVLKNSGDLYSFAKHLKNLSDGPFKDLFKEYLLSYSRLKKEFEVPSEESVKGVWFYGLREVLREEWLRIGEEKTKGVSAYLGFLATVANIAPFVGLFGTVWGIMGAFHRIGLKGSATLATVAPGIAEALIATAMGLFAAIPAAVSYNYFSRKAELLLKDLERTERRLVSLCQKDMLKEVLRGGDRSDEENNRSRPSGKEGA